MLELYQIAEQNNIEVFTGDIPKTKSLCVPGAICLDCRLSFDGAEERSHLAHELGHCIRGAFYTRSDPDYIRRRAENKADRWAIRCLIPEDALQAATDLGYTETWQLAEWFDVTEDLIAKALYFYQHGHMPPRQ